ncbi:MAG: Sec-independent protein translocase subunit TatA/TatB [Thermomicrobiales bacterium]
MFGIGAPELLVIAVLALIIFGPEKLPEIASQVGKAIRDFRRMSDELTGEFNRTMQLDAPPPAEALDPDPALIGETIEAGATPNGSYDASTTALQVQTIATDVDESLAPVSEPHENGVSTAPADTVITTNGVSHADEAELVPIATKADPLADVSLLDETPAVKLSADGAAEQPAEEPAAEPAPVVAHVPTTFDLTPAETPAYDAAAAWDAAATTELTTLPVTADAGAATAIVDEPAPVATEPTRTRIDPAAEVTIREKIEAQIAAEAFRERRRLASYHRPRHQRDQS